MWWATWVCGHRERSGDERSEAEANGHGGETARRSAATRSSSPPTDRAGSPSSSKPQPRARLAALADVGAAPRGAQLAHRPAAVHAGLALAQVDQEAVLEAARDAVGVAEVVD